MTHLGNAALYAAAVAFVSAAWTVWYFKCAPLASAARDERAALLVLDARVRCQSWRVASAGCMLAAFLSVFAAVVTAQHPLWILLAAWLGAVGGLSSFAGACATLAHGVARARNVATGSAAFSPAPSSLAA